MSEDTSQSHYTSDRPRSTYSKLALKLYHSIKHPFTYVYADEKQDLESKAINPDTIRTCHVGEYLALKLLLGPQLNEVFLLSDSAKNGVVSFVISHV